MMRCYFDENEIRKFVRQLASEDEAAAEEALDALSVSAREVMAPLLLEILPGSSDDLKQYICSLLAWCDEQECCVAPLLGLLDEDNDAVVVVAIEALENFARPGILQPLAQMLYSESPQVVEQAILSLGSMISCGVTEASEPLVNFVVERDSDLRVLAIQNLKYLEAEHLLPVVDKLRALGDADLEGEEDILKAVGLLCGPEFLRPLFEIRSNLHNTWCVRKEAEKAIHAIEKREGIEELSFLTIFCRQEINN